jgi:hypothetical protein
VLHRGLLVDCVAQGIVLPQTEIIENNSL